MPQPIILPPKPRKTGLLEPALKSLTQLGQMYAQGLMQQKLAEKNAATDYDYEGEGAERVFVIRDKKGNIIQVRPAPAPIEKNCAPIETAVGIFSRR